MGFAAQRGKGEGSLNGTGLFVLTVEDKMNV
jgi:hypothetical protein